MLYELKAILRNRITILCLFIFGILGVYAILCMYQYKEERKNPETLQLQYQAMADASQQEVESMEKDLDHFLNVICDTEEERNVTLNEYEYIKWCQNEYQKLADYAGSDEFNPEQFLKQELRVSLIYRMCNMNICAFEDKGCLPAEVVFAEELEQYKDTFKLEELPFELSEFVDSPFVQYQQKIRNLPYYYMYKWCLESDLQQFFYSDGVSLSDTSPFSLFVWLFGEVKQGFGSLIYGSLLLLFPALYMAECNKNNSRQLHELLPKRREQITRGYYRNIIFVCGLFFIA